MATDMVMVMATHMVKKIIMIDIHNHLLYGVDDGSTDIKMSEDLLLEFKKQGIKKIIMTPHVNSSVSKKPRNIHVLNYKKIRELAKKYDIDVFLGAEVYIPFRFPELDFKNYTMNNSNILLLEFSTYHKTPIYDHSYNLIKRGYRIIIAHVERYNYLKIDDLYELKELGVYFQINASSIINKKSIYHRNALKLIKTDLPDFVATDSHNLDQRPPKLREAYKKIKRLYGSQKANELVELNQIKLFFS